MFQASGGALLIKSPIFKQILFSVCSCKLYSSLSEYLLAVTEHNWDLLKRYWTHSVPSWQHKLPLQKMQARKNWPLATMLEDELAEYYHFFYWKAQISTLTA